MSCSRVVPSAIVMARLLRIEKQPPLNDPIFKLALAARLNMPMGTFAVAGAHGQTRVYQNVPAAAIK